MIHDHEMTMTVTKALGNGYQHNHVLLHRILTPGVESDNFQDKNVTEQNEKFSQGSL